jgi:hypothetical protein
MPKQEHLADADSLFGQLQRGRGKGYLHVLTVPRPEAWRYLVECICNDPRLDSQVEDRAGYYATLAFETGLELEPLFRYIREYDQDDGGWNTPLAVETLGELAKRGYKDAAQRLCDYVVWGQWWDWILDKLCAVQDPRLHGEIARRIERRFPLDSDLEEALAWVDLDADPWAMLVRHSTRISNLPNCGPIPELTSVFVQFRYSYGRARSAEAICVTAPGYFRENFAEECLWDCEVQTRALGARTADIQAEDITTRIGHLVSDIWEDEEVRDEARRRQPTF